MANVYARGRNRTGHLKGLHCVWHKFCLQPNILTHSNTFIHIGCLTCNRINSSSKMLKHNFKIISMKKRNMKGWHFKPVTLHVQIKARQQKMTPTMMPETFIWSVTIHTSKNQDTQRICRVILMHFKENFGQYYRELSKLKPLTMCSV